MRRACTYLQAFSAHSRLCEPALPALRLRMTALRSGETSPEVQRWQRTSIDPAAPISALVRCARRRNLGCSRLLARPHLASTQCAADSPLSLRFARNASFSRSSRFRHGLLLCSSRRNPPTDVARQGLSIPFQGRRPANDSSVIQQPHDMSGRPRLQRCGRRGLRSACLRPARLRRVIRHRACGI